MNIVHKVASVLVWVGALNWGLVGLSAFFGQNWNVVKAVLGSVPTAESIVYVLVGVSALYVAVTHKASCKDCCSVESPEEAVS